MTRDRLRLDASKEALEFKVWSNVNGINIPQIGKIVWADATTERMDKEQKTDFIFKTDNIIYSDINFSGNVKTREHGSPNYSIGDGKDLYNNTLIAFYKKQFTDDELKSFCKPGGDLRLTGEEVYLITKNQILNYKEKRRKYSEKYKNFYFVLDEKWVEENGIKLILI